MKLRFSPTSPFARKILILAIETGQDATLELVKTSTSDPANGLVRDNPLGKIPVLVLETGETFYDSRVICEYLDTRHQGTKLFPADGPARWKALRLQALADGIMDAALLRVYERKRPEDFRSPDWEAAQKQRVHQSLDALESEADKLGNQPDIGNITVACALGYLDFRFAHEPWAADRPRLAAWHQVFAARPSFAATTPKE